MNDQSIRNDIKQIISGTALCCLIMIAVYAFMGRFSLGVVLGALLALAAVALYYLQLASSVTKALEMGEEGKRYIQRSYAGRLMIHLGCALLAYFLPFVDTAAGIIPLLFPRIVLYAMQILPALKAKKEGNE
ncbi:MAG: hypothetical protein II488_04735 [Firmicutes bacterium]|nr:hypothetical protein [Bacillota bacterium]MBQ4371919.1 hypothetical protein [Bacillota bacterium]